ncbi:MAG: branched-chain amino acid ABC transporter permease [Chloroflexi bacterium]|nr:branched-chain amino acid ABC transporter permease [Chloroflexota bacterium]
MFWFDQLINGLTIGSVYALIALGYTLVYGILQMINFAHGEVFMLGAFAGYFVLLAVGGDDLGGATIIPAIVLAMFVAALASSSAAVVIERIAYRPLRNAPRLAPLISAIGVSVALQNIVLRMTGGRDRVYPRIFPGGSFGFGDFQVGYIQAFLIVASVLMMAALLVFIQRTRTGRAMRAVAENRATASLMGIDVDRTIVTTFVVGAALAGVAGVLQGLWIPNIRGTMGFLPGIKAFTAAVVGGIGSVPGAMVGGFFLGLTETVGRELLSAIPGVHLPNEWSDVIAFSLLVLVLVFRPTGIFGERVSRRA